MILEKGKKAFLIIGSVLLPVLAAGAIFVGSNNTIRPSSAASPTTLNSSNRPTLSNGAGSMIDDKEVTWEYYHAVDNPTGHISLQHNGYVGVSSSSQWGYTRITNVVVNYTAGSLGELWLLKSVNGVDWYEAKLLKKVDDDTSSSASSTEANNWRYIRLYFYDATENEMIDINSVSISYDCNSATTVSGPEDVDSALNTNVHTTNGLSHSRETSSLSPKSVGGEAVRFTKTGSGATNLTIKFNNTYTFGDTVNNKIEFDIWTQNVLYGKTIEVLNTETSYTSAKITAGGTNTFQNDGDVYIWTALGNNWYHAELPLTQIYTSISGYGGKDLPSDSTRDTQFNAIRINAGNCVIDNLRIVASPCELGIYNGKDYKPSVNEIYWVKTSWAGTLHTKEVIITFSDDTKAERIPLTGDSNLKNGSPFYIKIKASGELTIYVTVVSSYNHTSKSITKTITIQ